MTPNRTDHSQLFVPQSRPNDGPDSHRAVLEHGAMLNSALSSLPTFPDLACSGLLKFDHASAATLRAGPPLGRHGPQRGLLGTARLWQPTHSTIAH